MDFTQDRPATNDLDLGQFVPMGRSSIDRYTTIYHLTKWFGYSFSKRWWRSMLRQTSLAPFPEGSYQMEVGEKYDRFVSYRGGTGRIALHLGIRKFTNHAKTFFFEIIIVNLCFFIGLMHRKSFLFLF